MLCKLPKGGSSLFYTTVMPGNCNKDDHAKSWAGRGQKYGTRLVTNSLSGFKVCSTGGEIMPGTRNLAKYSRASEDMDIGGALTSNSGPI